MLCACPMYSTVFECGGWMQEKPKSNDESCMDLVQRAIDRRVDEGYLIFSLSVAFSNTVAGLDSWIP